MPKAARRGSDSEAGCAKRHLQPVCVSGLPSWSRGPFGSVVVVWLRRRRRALRLVGQVVHSVRVPPSAGPATRVSLRSVEPPRPDPRPPSRLCARSGCPSLAAAGRLPCPLRLLRRGAVGRSVRVSAAVRVRLAPFAVARGPSGVSAAWRARLRFSRPRGVERRLGPDPCTYVTVTAQSWTAP
jgi:hypothetical protein